MSGVQRTRGREGGGFLPNQRPEIRPEGFVPDVSDKGCGAGGLVVWHGQWLPKPRLDALGRLSDKTPRKCRGLNSSKVTRGNSDLGGCQKWVSFIHFFIHQRSGIGAK